ncbi:glycosyltransferase [Microgenomates group bacterium]|nr:glycosyltransferase [Microgenomates group bacterium]
MPFFTIVIPTLNEEKCLPVLLRNLAAQTFSDFNIIHIDAVSEDKTVSRAASFAKKLDLTTITSDKRNVAFQRNLGASHADGEWVIFMDADVELPPFFLQGIKYHIERTTLGARHKKRFDVFSTLIHLNDKDSRNRLNKTTATFLNTLLRAVETSDRPSAFGALIGVSRAMSKKVKFRTNTKILEDGLFIEDVIKAGGRFSLLSDPTYAYSLRRIHTAGLPKTASSFILMQARRYLLNDDFSEHDCDYKMLGGGEYK